MLALYLLLLRGGALARWERWGLIILIAVAASTHSATMAVFAGLVVCAALLWLFDRQRVTARGLAPGRAGARARRRSCFRRKLRGGRAARLDAGRLRALVRPHVAGRHRQEISRRALPRSQAAALRLQGRASAGRRPMVLGQSAVRPARPFRRPRQGNGDDRARRAGRLSRACSSRPRSPTPPGSSSTCTPAKASSIRSGTPTASSRRYTPQLVPAMRAARQQQGELSFDAINALQYPVALIAMALLPVDRAARGGGQIVARRHRRTGRHSFARHPRQCLCLRRAVQPARSLWRAHGLACRFREYACVY